MADFQKSSLKHNSLGGGILSDPIGLTLELDILVLKPSPCLPNGSQVYDWMGLDELVEIASPRLKQEPRYCGFK
ncbi:hypothetical protein TNCV_1316281 [Trichonephila clavipes]|nr:hypothetical protein TNCV_1316281 [Trichonephila clavipes]